MNCSVCLEKYEIFELLTLLECGHKFHFYCLEKSENIRCPICRNLILSKVNIPFCYTKTADIFEMESDEFGKYVNFFKSTRDTIFHLEKTQRDRINLENVRKLDETLSMFFKKNLTKIKFSIIKGTLLGYNVYDALEVKYNSVYNGYKEIDLLKCDKPYEEYYKDKGIITFIERVEDYFPQYKFRLHVDSYNLNMHLQVIFSNA